MNDYPPLESQTKPFLTTDEVAYYLNRKVQTLRIWAMPGSRYGMPPIRPHRFNGGKQKRPLNWKTSEVKALVTG